MKILIVTIILLISLECHATDALKENEGYLLLALNIENGYIPTKATLVGDGLFNKITINDFHVGMNYRVLSVKAGTYRWDRVFFNDVTYAEIRDRGYNINVTPKDICYGGHLSMYSEMNLQQDEFLGGIQFNYNNKSSRALSYLEIKFDPQLPPRALKYCGTERDDFFTYVRSIEAAKNDK